MNYISCLVLVCIYIYIYIYVLFIKYIHADNIYCCMSFVFAILMFLKVIYDLGHFMTSRNDI